MALMEIKENVSISSHRSRNRMNVKQTHRARMQMRCRVSQRRYRLASDDWSAGISHATTGWRVPSVN